MLCKITDEAYFKIDACSSSQLKTIYSKSVLHSLIEREPTESMKIGSAFHCMALEPHLFNDRYAIYPEYYEGVKTKAGKVVEAYVKEDWDMRKTDHKEFKERFEAENASRITLSHSDHANILAMTESLFKHPLSAKFLTGGQAEMIIVHDAGEPEATKIKMDYVKPTEHIIVDVKSCQSAAPQDVRRDIFKFLYDLQAAWYSMQYHAEYGEIPTFLFAFVESSYPHGVCWVQISPQSLIDGTNKVNVAYPKYLEFRATGIPKAYSDDVIII